MKIQTLVYLEQETRDALDKFVIRPCSRSDVIEDVMQYMMKNPDVLKSFVDSRNEITRRYVIEKDNQRNNPIVAQ